MLRKRNPTMQEDSEARIIIEKKTMRKKSRKDFAKTERVADLLRKTF